MIMKIRFLLLASFAALCLPSGVAAQTEKPILRKKPVPVKIGDRWWISKRDYKSTDVRIYADRALVEWGFMRLPSVDEKRSTYRNTAFPLPTAKQLSHELQFRLTVSAEGKLTECRYDPDPFYEPQMPVDPAAIKHACPMLQNHAQFFSALDAKGYPVGYTGAWSISYDLSLVSTRKNNYPPPMMTTRRTEGQERSPVPADKITLATLGLTEHMLHKNGPWAIIGYLKIDDSGKATACRLSVAINDDALDRQVCERAMAQNFSPGLNSQGTAREDEYFLLVER
jgi:hypothetical protein